MSMMDSFNETLQSELANKGQGVPVARDQQVTELAEFMGRLSGGLRHFAGQIIDAGWTMRSTPSAIPVGFRDPEFSWATISAENKARMEGLGHDLSCFSESLYAEQPAPVALHIPDECPHMIVFDDTERDDLMFSGAGAREAALKMWEKISMSWNAHLFVRVGRNSRDDGHPCAKFAPVAVVMPFDFEHPLSKERRTVTLTKRDVFDGMEDYFYDKLSEQICQCESVGETNVVDCNCDEYVHDFEIVQACLDEVGRLNSEPKP